MKSIYQNIVTSISKDEKQLDVLIDPDKMSSEVLPNLIVKVNTSMATHIFVGGSKVDEDITDIIVSRIKELISLPVVLFPGDVIQITDKADALLFLSLIFGRNPEYLIEKHVEAVSVLRQTNLEVIPAGYILIENSKKTAVEKVTQTNPLARNNIQYAVDKALAGEFLGMKRIYLEAGSGATDPVEIKMISKVKKRLNIPLIIGGGIRTKQRLYQAFNAGADLVVIGTVLKMMNRFLKI